jgi:hypothetical protein
MEEGESMTIPSPAAEVAARQVIDDLVRELDNEGEMDKDAYETAVSTIRSKMPVVAGQVQAAWEDIQRTFWALTAKMQEEAFNEAEIQYIIAFSVDGVWNAEYCGNVQYWQGASMSEYPFRAYAAIPCWTDVDEEGETDGV